MGTGMAWHGMRKVCITIMLLLRYLGMIVMDTIDCFSPQPCDRSCTVQQFPGISPAVIFPITHPPAFSKIAFVVSASYSIPGRDRQATAAQTPQNLGRIAHRSTLAGISAGAPTCPHRAWNPACQPLNVLAPPRARAHRHMNPSPPSPSPFDHLSLHDDIRRIRAGLFSIKRAFPRPRRPP